MILVATFNVPCPEHGHGLAVTLRGILNEIERREAGEGTVTLFPSYCEHAEATEAIVDALAKTCEHRMLPRCANQ